MTTEGAAPSAERHLERARDLVFWWETDNQRSAGLASRGDLIDRVMTALARVDAETLEQYVRTVDDPKRAHLHYDACPFKPFADSDIDGGDYPDCTCAAAHIGAYWKGQFVLERGYKKLATRETWEMAARHCDEYAERVGGGTGAAETAHRIAHELRALASEGRSPEAPEIVQGAPETGGLAT